jgi:hypothetical protein
MDAINIGDGGPVKDHNNSSRMTAATGTVAIRGVNDSKATS